MASRDKRIQVMEEPSRISIRLEIVRTHGTIEDLIARMAVLETSVSKKHEKIAVLQKEAKNIRSPSD